jgi:SAM domain (Sterile alpha motif)
VDIGAWLQSLSLERYEQQFLDNEIDWSILPKLTAEDLKDLGVTLVGHRRRLLEAIAALEPQPAQENEAPERTEVVDHSAATPARAPGSIAERRQLTVMFVDLLRSTESQPAARSRGDARRHPGLPEHRRR